MNKITVVGTFHTETGACTYEELLKIIQKISPKVIFCEVSPEEFPAMLASENASAPEIKALRVLIKNCSMVNVIPIDLLDRDPSLDSRLDAMFDSFINSSREYLCAIEIHAHEIQEKGFPYLNGDDSDQIFRDKHSMQMIFVSKSNHLQLSKTHNDWLELNDKRENHWIKLIHEYFKGTENLTAVFLVGAGHRERLKEKVPNYQAENQIILDWDFNPFNHIFK